MDTTKITLLLIPHFEQWLKLKSELDSNLLRVSTNLLFSDPVVATVNITSLSDPLIHISYKFDVLEENVVNSLISGYGMALVALQQVEAFKR